MNKDDVIRKARKLMDYEHGNCSEGELENAASILQQLLQTYELSTDDIQATVILEDIAQTAARTQYASIPAWLGALACDVADAYNCRVLSYYYYDAKLAFGTAVKVGFRFVGEKAEVQIASWFFELLYTRLYDLATTQAATRCVTGRNIAPYRNSFIRSASRAIKRRLIEDQRVAMQADPALKAIILSKKGAIDVFMQRYAAMEHRGISTTDDFSGTFDGHRAGKNIHLTRGVNGVSKSTKQIGGQDDGKSNM